MTEQSDEVTITHGTPTVQIERRGLGYDVQVITERVGLGGFGWSGYAPTRRSAERLAARLLAGREDPHAIVVEAVRS